MLAEPLRTLIDKVAKSTSTVTDDDIAAAKASDFSEDQIFELVVCATIGQATRQYDTALAALKAATETAYPRGFREWRSLDALVTGSSFVVAASVLLSNLEHSIHPQRAVELAVKGQYP